jgi:hypothetical protein
VRAIAKGQKEAKREDRGSFRSTGRDERVENREEGFRALAFARPERRR